MSLVVYNEIAAFFEAIGRPIASNTAFTMHSLPDLFTSIPYQSKKFRTNYFSFVFIKKGAGTYWVDDKQFQVTNHCIYFTNPGHVKSFDVDTCEEAYMINVTEQFLKDYLGPSIFNDYAFLLAEILPAETISEEVYNQIEGYYKRIESELKMNENAVNQILAYLMAIIFSKLKTNIWQNYSAYDEGEKNSQIVGNFKRILDTFFKIIPDFSCENPAPKLQDFADRIGLHPNYLNTVIKAKTGKTINDWITDRKLTFAKYLLLNSALSVKEIAYRMDFSEPTHFSRFFKNHTQLNPMEFKSSEKS